MADDEAGKPDGETKGSDEFDPRSLGPEAAEYIRRKVQSESNVQTAAVEKKLRDEQAVINRSAVETAEQNEFRHLAETGQHEALGQRVAARISQRSVEDDAIKRSSDVIERQMTDTFSETLGPERVAQIKREVVQKGGAHAEFAEALAEAQGGESRKEEIAAEVKAQLMEARGEKRDEAGGADKVSGSGQGTNLSDFNEIEKAYVAGTLPGGREAYEEARKANKKGR